MTVTDDQLLEYFGTFISSERKALIEDVLQNRTRHITVVLEDIYQPQNASAVVRTCDCFGIQDLHIIENKHEYKLNPRVVHGASKWVDIYRYNLKENNTSECFRQLREQGYRIIGTTPSKESMDIHDLTIDEPLALVFGTEATGLSSEAMQSCDALVTFPMHGFTESLNISVSVSLCLSELVRRLHASDIEWSLDKDGRNAVLLNWYRKSVSRPDILERDFIKKLQ